jgi:hypothetical protein
MRALVALVAFLAVTTSAAAGSDWIEQVIAGHTLYTVTQTPLGPVIVAAAHGTASRYVTPMSVDLKRTPCLSWSWRADKFPGKGDETTRANDDFAARVYVFTDGKLKGGIVYLWSRALAPGRYWRSPYSSRTAMVVRSGAPPSNRLMLETRNVADDIEHTDGVRPASVVAVGIMADADDSHGEAVGAFGEFHWTDCRQTS